MVKSRLEDHYVMPHFSTNAPIMVKNVLFDFKSLPINSAYEFDVILGELCYWTVMYRITIKQQYTIIHIHTVITGCIVVVGL